MIKRLNSRKYCMLFVLLTLVLAASMNKSFSQIGYVSGENFSGSQFSIASIAAGGDSTPIGGTFVRDGTPALGSSSALNDNGDVAFWAQVTGGEARLGIFLASGDKITKVVAIGDSTPIGGIFSDLSFFVSLNSAGDVAFKARITGAPPEEGIFLASKEGIVKVVVQGDSTPIGGLFSWIGNPLLNNNGQVAFRAGVLGGSARGGFFLASKGTLTKIVAMGDRTPVGGTFSDFVPSGDARNATPLFGLNDAGDLAFGAWMTGGSAPYGLFLSSGKTITKVVAQGDRTPMGGTFGFALTGHINNRSDVVFDASVSGGGSSDGIFLSSKGEITKVVATGDSAPMGGTFRLTPAGVGGSNPRINDEGDITFEASVSPLNIFGIFLSSEGDIEKVVARGDSTPIGETFLWTSFSALNKNNSILIGEAGIGINGQPHNQGIFLVSAPNK